MFVTVVYKYNTITILEVAHRPVFYLKLNSTQLNSICLSVTHRKHITSPLRARQVNAIYRFVTEVCGSLVVKALGYKPEVRGFETRCLSGLTRLWGLLSL
jgi:hypothetical protein